MYYDVDQKKLVIQDIFSNNTFYRSFNRDIIFTGPPIEIEFTDGGNKLLLTYMRENDYKEITEIFDLS